MSQVECITDSLVWTLDWFGLPTALLLTKYKTNITGITIFTLIMTKDFHMMGSVVVKYYCYDYIYFYMMVSVVVLTCWSAISNL